MMFERFTLSAKELVMEARSQRRVVNGGRAAAGGKVRTEHLLLALLADDGPTGQALRGQGLDTSRILTRLNELEAPTDPKPVEADDQLLKGIGIDVEAIRRSLDEAFGTRAFDRAREGRHGDSTRRGRRASRPQGQFDSRSKRVLELSLREALRLKTKHIGPEHIGLGLLREGEGVACQMLSEEGVELTQLRSSWEAIARGAV